MPGLNTTTVGSTLQEEEYGRILLERQQECLDQLALNATRPPGQSLFLFSPTHLSIIYAVPLMSTNKRSIIHTEIPIIYVTTKAVKFNQTYI